MAGNGHLETMHIMQLIGAQPAALNNRRMTVTKMPALEKRRMGFTKRRDRLMQQCSLKRLVVAYSRPEAAV